MIRMDMLVSCVFASVRRNSMAAFTRCVYKQYEMHTITTTGDEVSAAAAEDGSGE